MIVTIEDLARVRADHPDEKIVLTSGTFDLFHVGHVKYLEAVKSHGQVMIAMLSGDKRVKYRKGPSRPIIPEADRAKILDSNQLVDYVFIDDGYNEPARVDPRYARILADLRPEVYATDGEDIRFSELTGHATEMVIVPRVEGGQYASTSAIIERLVSLSHEQEIARPNNLIDN